MSSKKFLARDRLRASCQKVKKKLVERLDFLNTSNYSRAKIKFINPTHFVPYSHHSCALADCATRLPEFDGLLPLVSVR